MNGGGYGMAISGNGATVAGLRLRIWRRENNLTQEELAELLGTAQATVSRLEIEGDVPSKETFEALKNLMGDRCPWEDDCGRHRCDKRGRQGPR